MSTPPQAAAWLPPWFTHPPHLELDSGFHLRPLRAVDVGLDLPAVLGSRAALWRRFGAAWGWPPADLDAESDRRDLERQERETAEHVSFTYGVLDEPEDTLVGCVYLDPPRGGTGAADVDVSWWTVTAPAGTALEEELRSVLPGWVAREWPFRRPRYVGVDVSWSQWAQLAAPA
ncbi:GNAT family N-acetyltransferase [Kineococcus rhizosphaerae]|uniref:Acetyltransferase (GNAT) family protein n=1 Tax=Kineococcus rhizosphaerae TaxID=559628 RepID=A0A2T0R7F2_9ACTN|nr:GNAT family N-acetyltransferase [Kineococcus rhizosphaerae]PRY17095.1 hypothetical protein CLV37_10251 [Kineococcus rhizosphaerae]